MACGVWECLTNGMHACSSLPRSTARALLRVRRGWLGAVFTQGSDATAIYCVVRGSVAVVMGTAATAATDSKHGRRDSQSTTYSTDYSVQDDSTDGEAGTGAGTGKGGSVVAGAGGGGLGGAAAPPLASDAGLRLSETAAVETAELHPDDARMVCAPARAVIGEHGKAVAALTAGDCFGHEALRRTRETGRRHTRNAAVVTCSQMCDVVVVGQALVEELRVLSRQDVVFVPQRSRALMQVRGLCCVVVHGGSLMVL